MAVLAKTHHVREIKPSQKHVVHASHTLLTEMHCICKSLTACDRFVWDFWTFSSAGSVPLRITSDTLSCSQSNAGLQPLTLVFHIPKVPEDLLIGWVEGSNL